MTPQRTVASRDFRGSDDAESEVAHGVEKGGGRIVSIGDHIIGKTWTQVGEGAAQKPSTRTVLAGPRAVPSLRQIIIVSTGLLELKASRQTRESDFGYPML